MEWYLFFFLNFPYLNYGSYFNQQTIFAKNLPLIDIVNEQGMHVLPL